MRRVVVTTVAILVVVAGLAGATNPETPGRIDNERPLADAGLDQDVDRGATVLLDGTGSRDPDGRIVEYEWSITRPDGTTVVPDCVECPRTRFVPNATGRFAVTLAVTDDDGARATDTLYVNVSPGRPPTVELTGPSRVSRGETATYVADVTPGAAPLDRVVWAVDGRQIATQTLEDGAATVTRPITVESVGSRRVTATVQDRDGQTAVGEHTVEVTARDDGDDPDDDGDDPDDGSGDDGTSDGSGDTPGGDGCSSDCEGGKTNPAPTVVLTSNETRVDQGSSVSFDATASTDNGAIREYDWSATGTTIAGNSPTNTRTFEEPGTYTVTVTATDDGRPTGTEKRGRDSVEIEVCDGECGSGRDGAKGGSTRWILDIDGPQRVTLVTTDTGSYVEPVAPVYTVNLETTAENADTEVTPWFTDVRFYLEDENGRTLDSWSEASRTQAASREIDMKRYLSGLNAPEKLYVRAEVTREGTTYDVLREVETCVKWSPSAESGCGTEESLPPFTVSTTGPAEIKSGNSVTVEANYGQASYYDIDRTDWWVPLLGSGGSGKTYSKSFVVPENQTQKVYRISVESKATFRAKQFDSVIEAVTRLDDGAHYVTVKRGDVPEDDPNAGTPEDNDDGRNNGKICPPGKEPIRDECVDEDFSDVIEGPNDDIDDVVDEPRGGDDRMNECPEGMEYDPETGICVVNGGDFTDW